MDPLGTERKKGWRGGGRSCQILKEEIGPRSPWLSAWSSSLVEGVSLPQLRAGDGPRTEGSTPKIPASERIGWGPSHVSRAQALHRLCAWAGAVDSIPPSFLECRFGGFRVADCGCLGQLTSPPGGCGAPSSHSLAESLLYRNGDQGGPLVRL